jgi:metallo-beta-lactamase family protein
MNGMTTRIRDDGLTGLNLRGLAAILVVAVTASLGAADVPRLTIHGAAGQVSGSLALLEADGKRWVADCGLLYGGEVDDDAEESSRTGRDEPFPIAPGSIDGVFLTHAHLDHVGRLPQLVTAGYRGPVWTTRGTRQLLPEMLRMAVAYSNEPREWTYSQRSVKYGRFGRYGKVHWRADCEGAAKIAPQNERTASGRRNDLERELRFSFDACEICTRLEVGESLALVRELPYGKPVRLTASATVTALDAGHIPGSASFLFEAGRGEAATRVIVSGDLGSGTSPLILGPRPFPPADTIVVEGTYGGVSREAKGDELAAFRAALGAEAKKGRVVWIPAFALDRTQKVLHEIELAKREGTLGANVPVFCLSPTGNRLTEIYESERRRRGDEAWFTTGVRGMERAFASCRTKPAGKGDRYSVESYPRPSIVLSSSGMMDAGSSAGLLPSFIAEADVTVMVVGYQDPRTAGGRLLAGAKTLRIGEKDVPVRASVRDMKGFSGHVDFDGVLGLLVRQRKDVRLILVHGDTARLARMKARLGEAGYMDVVVAGKGERILLGTLR